MSLSFMASIPKPLDSPESKATLLVIFLVDVDLQKAYKTSQDLSKKYDGVFHGLFLYELPTRQPIICDNLNFDLPIANINALVGDLLLELKLERRQVKFQITSSPSPVAKPLPIGMIS